MFHSSYPFRAPLALCAAAGLAMALGGCGSVPTASTGGFTTVVIDAGHGGQDSGARSHFGLTEKSATLDTAKRLQPLLQRAGFRTVMTRTDDTFVELDQRVNIANRYPNAVFVSIHYNYSPSGNPTGIETFYWWTKSFGLATHVEHRLVASTGLPSRGSTRRVLRMTHNPQIPCILCECGFLSNSAEANQISNPEFRQRVAQGIAAGIIDQRQSGDTNVGPLPSEPPAVPYEHGPSHSSH